MSKKRKLIKWVVLAMIVIAILLPYTSLYQFGFDSDKVYENAEIISKEQHPVGSDAIRRVRDYLVSYLSSLEYEVDTIKLPINGNSEYGYTENIIVKIPGEEPGHGIAMCGHYDSVPASYGANDDGSAVVAMLEAARLIKDKQFKQDVYFIFTDGEERGLLGSKALKENGYLDGIDYVFNFEARGASGPSLMYATSDLNYKEVKLLSKSNFYMRGNSIMSFAYERMPNNTDFKSFKEAGIRGFEFAYIGTGQYYHSLNDSIDNFNMQGVRQHTYYMHNALNTFANRDNKDLTSEENGIYFSYLNHLIVLSYFQVILLTLVAIAILLWIMYRKYVNIKSMTKWLISIVLNLISMFAVGLLVFILQTVIFRLLVAFKVDLTAILSKYIIHSSVILYIIVVIISLLIAKVLKMLMNKWVKVYDSKLGMSIIVMILTIVLTLKFPPLSFLGIFYVTPIIISLLLDRYSKFWGIFAILLIVPLLWPALLTVYRAFGQVTWPLIGVVVASWILCLDSK